MYSHLTVISMMTNVQLFVLNKIEEKACLEEKVATYRDKYKKNKESKERYKNVRSFVVVFLHSLK